MSKITTLPSARPLNPDDVTNAIAALWQSGINLTHEQRQTAARQMVRTGWQCRKIMDAGEFEIAHDQPKGCEPRKYPWAEMAIGETIRFAEVAAPRLYASFYAWCSRNNARGARITTRTVLGAVEVTRTA